MDEFEKQLEGVYPALERYVKYRLNGTADAEDLLQEICLVAWQKQAQLQNKEAFKPWLLSIARNRCYDYFRRKGRDREIPLEELPEHYLTDGLYRKGTSPIEETLDLLTEREQRILRLFYWQNLSLAEIAGKLNIPLGTVKSRLNSARNRFRDAYPYPPEGVKHMTKLPDTLKPYTIERLEEEPFPVRWEELPGWLIVPRLGENLSWALYDWPSRKRAEYTEIAVTGKAEVHGIEGVEIRAIQYGKGDPHSTGCADKLERRFVAQLTETHSRYLAESHMENGIRKCYTFLDGDAFMANWGCGEGNCGNQVYLSPRGFLKREGDVVTSRDGKPIRMWWAATGLPFREESATPSASWTASTTMRVLPRSSILTETAGQSCGDGLIRMIGTQKIRRRFFGAKSCRIISACVSMEKPSFTGTTVFRIIFWDKKRVEAVLASTRIDYFLADLAQKIPQAK